MSARITVNVERESHRFAGFGGAHEDTPRVSVSVSFAVGNGQAALDTLRSAVAEAEADIRKAGGAQS